MTRYLDLWRIPGAPLLLLGGIAARLGHGVTIIAWLVLVRAVNGDFAAAGLVAGTLSLATAFAAPVLGRLVDRHAVRTVLPLIALLYAVTQGLLLGAVLLQLPLPVVLAGAAISGALFPPMSPAIRSGWTHLTRPGSGHESCRTTAMAAESTAFELVFVTGPLVLSAFILLGGALGAPDPASTGAAWAIGAAAATTALGTAVVSRGTALGGLPSGEPGRRTNGIGPLTVPGFPTMLAITAAVAFSFGASPVAIAAFAESADPDNGSAVTGILIAVWSLGSAAGGLVYGALPLREGSAHARLGARLLVVLIALTGGYAAWNLVDGVPAFAVLLVVSGAVIAPATAILAEMVAAAVPAHMLTEAYTWFTCVNMSTAALGAAIAGRMADSAGGVQTVIWTCAAAGAVAVATALARATRRRAEPVRDPEREAVG